MARILFIGSINEKNLYKGSGGQLKMSLQIVELFKNENLEYYVLDTTMHDNKNRLFIERLYQGFKRIFLFTKLNIFHKWDFILIFSSGGLSFYEKGFMTIFSHSIFNNKVVFSLRSGKEYEMIKSNANRFHLKVFNTCDSILYQTEYQLNILKKIITKSKFYYFPNWSHNKKIIHRNYKQKGDINLLFVGWLIEEKGVIELVKALKLVKNKKVKLNIVGDGDLKDKLMTLVKKLNLTENIKLHGWKNGDELIDFYLKNDIYITPSHNEGLSNSLIEALSYSLPVFCSKINAFTDVLKNNAIYFDLKDEKSISKTIDKYSENIEILSEFSTRSKVLFNKKFNGNISKKNLLKSFQIETNYTRS